MKTETEVTYTPTPCACEKLRKLIAHKNGEDATDYLLLAVNVHEELVEYIKNNHAIHMGRGHEAMLERKGFCSTCQLIAKAEVH